MNKIWNRVLASAMMCGVMTLSPATQALADNVVTVSSLPSSASQYTTSNNQNKSSVTTAVEPGDEVNLNKAATPIISAAVNVQTANTVTAQSVSTVSTSESGKVTIPVINAADTIEASNAKKAAASEQKTASASTEKIGIIDTTLENLSLSAQAIAATEEGFCVILSSSPAGLLTDMKK